MVNHLLEHDLLSDVQLQRLLDDLDRVPLSEKAPIFNENPPIVGRPQDSGTRRTLYCNYGNYVGGAQNRPVAAVAIGYDLPPISNRPLTLDCFGHPATRCPQLGLLDGLGHVQFGESKIPPLV